MVKLDPCACAALCFLQADRQKPVRNGNGVVRACVFVIVVSTLAFQKSRKEIQLQALQVMDEFQFVSQQHLEQL
jgi:hypothetical protein